MSLRRFPASERRGSILLLFVFFLLAFMGVLALIVDYGFVQLARRQMQTGVNTAALEGLRYRDALPDSDTLAAVLDDPSDPRDPNDPDESQVTEDQWRDYVRRRAARRILRSSYNENLSTASPNSGTTGAGPVLEIQEDPPGTKPNQPFTVHTITSQATYVPDPQLNLDNAAHGDLVARAYDPDGSHEEEPDYFREDFNVLSTRSGFLARLRRTRPAISGIEPPLDNISDVSSSERALPLLFGRFSPFVAGDLIRSHGVIVRATSITDGHPAKVVGPPFRDRPGLSVAALESDYWNSNTLPEPEGDFVIWIRHDGVITTDEDGDDEVGRMIRATLLGEDAPPGTTEIEVRSNSSFPVNPDPSGTFHPFDVSLDDQIVTVTSETVIVDPGTGQRTTTWTIDPPSSGHPTDQLVLLRGHLPIGAAVPDTAEPFGLSFAPIGYVPLYPDPESGSQFLGVVGFGWLEGVGQPLPTDSGDYPVQVTLTKRIGRIAPGNASTALRTLPDDVTALFTLHRQVNGPLLAPAQVRSVR